MTLRPVILAGIVALLVFAALPAAAQSCSMDVSGTAYFQSGYKVGLTCSWSPVSGASSYLVKHYRKDACGEATVFTTTTSTSSSSGAHQNCDPDSCYFKSCEVHALDSQGAVINCGSASICQTGCESGGSCPPCNANGICDSGEDLWGCPQDCQCPQDEFCKDHSWCPGGACSNNKCVCL